MSGLDKIGVACTALGGRLVLYRRGKDARVALEQREAEPEIMRALIEHMLHDTEPGVGMTKTVTFGDERFDITVVPSPGVKATSEGGGDCAQQSASTDA